MDENHFNRFALTFENSSESVFLFQRDMQLQELNLYNQHKSYIFPFAIIKWMVVLSKYGGLLKLLSSDKNQSKKLPCARYIYELQLMTMCKGDVVDYNEVSHVSMVMECDGIQLSYCGQECRRIPPALQKMYGSKVKYLDLSYNSIETLKGLEDFTRLEELILDNNKLGDGLAIPYLPRLRTLSLNNNQIIELNGLVDKLCASCPFLSYLSLLSNKACPNELSDLDKDDCDYQRYRYFVIYKLPKLRFLDSRRVSSTERAEAATRGQFMSVRRPTAELDAGPVSRVSPANRGLRALPVDFSALGKHKGAYGKCQYKYTGKHSEGNRFIVNSDL